MKRAARNLPREVRFEKPREKSAEPTGRVVKGRGEEFASYGCWRIAAKNAGKHRQAVGKQS